ncbi:hypothetical protein NDN08_007436 [Rhodosorus marinus]|uniref:Uncharacterized protein n=1 Tax=Rhodosorus marinus TaxID=101924 RepID=A0AAV8V156_9RHOD|nr:hypothetical protein NDN08_007436 [Rhodosorus marinus]
MDASQLFDTLKSFDQAEEGAPAHPDPEPDFRARIFSARSDGTNRLDLSNLDLSDASLCTLLDAIGSVEKHVQVVDMSMNFLTGSPQDNPGCEAGTGFANKFPDVQSLDLSGNSLTSIPGFVTAFRNLKEIDVSDNSSLAIFDTSVLPKSVRHVYARNCALTKFPEPLDALPGTSVLQLSGNRICTVPGDIGELENLVYLNISDNEIENLPDEVAEADQLRALVLYRNRRQYGYSTDLNEFFSSRDALRSDQPAL